MEISKESKTKLISNLYLVDKLNGSHELTVHVDSSLKIPAVDQGARRDLLCCSRDSFHAFEGGFNFRKLKCLPSYDEAEMKTKLFKIAAPLNYNNGPFPLLLRHN